MILFKPQSTKEKGFTLIEVMVSILIFTLLGLGIIELVSSMVSTGNKTTTFATSSDQARKLSFQIMNELRNAVTASTGAYALNQAGDQELIFFSNVDGGTDIERVRYYLSSGKVYRGVVKASGSPLTYNLGNETTAVVQNDVANGGIPLFYYYADTYDGSGNYLAQPVNITQVKFIELNLQVYNKGGIANTNFYTITAGSSIRSLKTNLGN